MKTIFIFYKTLFNLFRRIFLLFNCGFFVAMLFSAFLTFPRKLASLLTSLTLSFLCGLPPPTLVFFTFTKLSETMSSSSLDPTLLFLMMAGLPLTKMTSPTLRSLLISSDLRVGLSKFSRMTAMSLILLLLTTLRPSSCFLSRVSRGVSRGLSRRITRGEAASVTVTRSTSEGKMKSNGN